MEVNLPLITLPTRLLSKEVLRFQEELAQRLFLLYVLASLGLLSGSLLHKGPGAVPLWGGSGCLVWEPLAGSRAASGCWVLLFGTCGEARHAKSK